MGNFTMTAGKKILPTTAKRTKYWLLTASLLAFTGLSTQGASAHTKTHHHATTTHHIVASHHVTHATTHHLATATTHHTFSHTRETYVSHRATSHYYARNTYGHRLIHYASARYRHSYLQCVPYAREVSHIDLSGNAFLWWAEAAGRYARGSSPAEGAVLNFRPIGRMPLGHVAVVTSVIDNRNVLVTQANWIRGTITNDVTVTDVSPDNDWTQVQVELGDGDKMGAAYPTYGFIYNQPDNGTVIAGTTIAQSTEVAEAPRPATVATDAPDRNLQ